MDQLYEVQISVNGEDGHGSSPYYHVEHRTDRLPEKETVVALKDEAVAYFRALYPDEPVGLVSVSLIYLTVEERKPPENGDRDRATA